MSEKRRYSLFPKLLAQCVEPLTRPIFKAQGLAGSRILTDWPEIVGTKLASHCFPEKLSFPHGKKSGGTLTIAVENGFALEIQHMEPVILEKLSTYYGYKAVSRIMISHAFTPELLKPPAKPEAVLPADCLKISEEIEDKELRNALQSLANTLAGKPT